MKNRRFRAQLLNKLWSSKTKTMKAPWFLTLVNGQWSQWSMVNGQWLMVTMVNGHNGQWSMVNGQWSMVNGQWSMVNGQWLMVNG